MRLIALLSTVLPQSFLTFHKSVVYLLCHAGYPIERSEQAVGFCDLWDFHPLTETWQHRSEKLTGGRVPAELMIEFCQRERGPQLKCSRPLSSGDLDGIQEGLLCRSGIRQPVAEQKLAANAVYLRREPALPRLPDFGQLGIYRAKTIVEAARFSFGFGKQRPVKRLPVTSFYFLEQPQTFAHSSLAVVIASAPAAPAEENTPVSLPKWQSVLVGEADHSPGVRHHFARFATDGRKHAHVVVRHRERRNVPALTGEAERFLCYLGSSINLTKRPEHPSKVKHGMDARIVTKTGGQLSILLMVMGTEGQF